MINIAPTMLDLLVRDRHGSLRLEAGRRRLAAAPHPDRHPPDRRRRLPSMRPLRALRSLGARAVPALDR